MEQKIVRGGELFLDSCLPGSLQLRFYKCLTCSAYARDHYRDVTVYYYRQL